MKVRRIVANLAADDVARLATFYRDLFGLDLLMDHGWIATVGSELTQSVQLGIASQGGNGTPVPGLSIEVDDLDEALARVGEAGIAVEYGPADEPWGVSRFFIRDPGGTLVNILVHR